MYFIITRALHATAMHALTCIAKGSSFVDYKSACALPASSVPTSDGYRTSRYGLF